MKIPFVAKMLARRLYRPEVYARHAAGLSDTRVMAFRKCAA